MREGRVKDAMETGADSMTLTFWGGADRKLWQRSDSAEVEG